MIGGYFEGKLENIDWKRKKKFVFFSKKIFRELRDVMNI